MVMKKAVMAPLTTIHPLCRTLLIMVLMTRRAILKGISLLIVELRTERSEKERRTEMVFVSGVLNFGVAVVF